MRMAGASENEGNSSILHRLTEYEIHRRRLSDDIGTRWKDLARELGFNEAFITATESDKDCNKECCIALLVKWMGQEGERGATHKKLATALTNIGLQTLADKLIDPLNMRLIIPIEVEKTITLDDAHQELDNSVNTTIQITVNTPEETKIMKTSDVKELDISDELKCLQEKLSDIKSTLDKGELKEESFPITSRLDFLDRQSRALQELYTKVTGMTGEAYKCDELVRRNFYDFTYHSLRSVHDNLCARAADLQSAEATMREKEKETLRSLISYQRGREKQVEQLEKLWIGLFSPMKKAYSESALNKGITTPKSGAQIRKSLSFSEGNLTKVKTRRKYEFTGLIKRKSDGIGPVLVKFSEAGEEN